MAKTIETLEELRRIEEFAPRQRVLLLRATIVLRGIYIIGAGLGILAATLRLLQSVS